jgi:hypothetical protein
MGFLSDLLFLVVFLAIWYILMAKVMPRFGIRT